MIALGSRRSAWGRQLVRHLPSPCSLLLAGRAGGSKHSSQGRWCKHQGGLDSVHSQSGSAWKYFSFCWEPQAWGRRSWPRRAGSQCRRARSPDPVPHERAQASCAYGGLRNVLWSLFSQNTVPLSHLLLASPHYSLGFYGTTVNFGFLFCKQKVVLPL